MKRAFAWTGLTLIVGLAAWQAAQALQESPAQPAASDVATSAAPEAPLTDGDAPKVDAPRAPATAIPGNRTATPMTERVATLGVLNKRNGLSRDLRMKPGQAVRLGDLVVRLRACEQTAPWEQEKWTGAFVQVITRETRTVWRKTFSGWLYKESPSLNVVEHPIYDVWVKTCTMRHADVGPATLVVRGAESGAASSRSNAPKSGGEDMPAPLLVDSASASNTE